MALRWKRIGTWMSVFLCAAFSGCGGKAQQGPLPQHAVAVEQAPPTPIETKRVETGGPAWNPAWDTLIERSLPPELLSTQAPKDVRRYCPRFFTMDNEDKRAFWAYFFQALSGAEAGLNARSNATHRVSMGRDAVTGLPIRSEGLLQLTYEDSQRYGCDFDWKADRELPLRDPRKTILQPQNNLECGIKILDKQVIDERKPLFTRSSYWGTLRPGTLSYRVFAKQMTNPPEACGLHEARHSAGRRRSAARPVAATAPAASSVVHP